MTKSTSSRTLNSTVWQITYPGCSNKARKLMKYQTELFFSTGHLYLTYSLSGLWYHHPTTHLSVKREPISPFSYPQPIRQGSSLLPCKYYSYLPPPLYSSHHRLSEVPCPPHITFATISCSLSTPPPFQSILLFTAKDYPEMQV